MTFLRGINRITSFLFQGSGLLKIYPMATSFCQIKSKKHSKRSAGYWLLIRADKLFVRARHRLIKNHFSPQTAITICDDGLAVKHLTEAERLSHQIYVRTAGTLLIEENTALFCKTLLFLISSHLSQI